MLSAALLLMMSTPTAAALPETSGQWLTAAPPRADLPAVEVAIGYPGGYLPNGFVPITLRANAARAFEGVIAFRFVGRGRPTPVMTRVSLGPGEPWSFRTWALLPVGDRQLHVEWRDRELNLLGTARVAELPKQRERVLRVVPDPAAAPAETLGEATYAVTPSDLPAEAQWYTGFRAMAVPTAAWLDLPPATREAIFGSGIPIVFTGTPRAGQTIGTKDRALLPVSFEPRPGSYTVPWPYAAEGAAPIATSMSWRPGAGAPALGTADAPYIVIDRVTAAWAADEKALELPLPALAAVAMGRDEYAAVAGSLPTIPQLLRAHVPMIVTILAALLALALWLQSRRVPRLAIAAVALAASLLIVAAESRIRPLPDRHDIEIITPISPGLVERYHGRYLAAAAPLDEEVRPPDLVTTWVHGVDGQDRLGEIRGANTPPGAGSIFADTGVEAILRWSSRREEGTAPRVKVVSHDPASVTLEFESPDPVDEVRAAWNEAGKLRAGAATLSGLRSGTVTVRAGQYIWNESSWFMEYRTDWGPRDPFAARSGIRVSLIHRTRARTRELRWWKPYVGGAPNESVRVNGTLRPAAAEPDALSGLFVLPPNRAPGESAKVSLPFAIPVARVTLTWPTGSAPAPLASGGGVDIATRAYAVPPDALRQIAASGGVFRVTVHGSGSLPAETNSSIELWGKP